MLGAPHSLPHFDSSFIRSVYQAGFTYLPSVLQHLSLKEPCIFATRDQSRQPQELTASHSAKMATCALYDDMNYASAGVVVKLWSTGLWDHKRVTVAVVCSRVGLGILSFPGRHRTCVANSHTGLDLFCPSSLVPQLGCTLCASSSGAARVARCADSTLFSGGLAGIAGDGFCRLFWKLCDIGLSPHLTNASALPRRTKFGLPKSSALAHSGL